MHTFSFDGIQKSYLVLEREWSLPAFAPIEREFTSVRGRPGGKQSAFKTGIRRFSLPIIIRSKNEVEKKRFVEDMAAWLIHKDAKPMTFTKYPNRTLFAAIEGAPDFKQIYDYGEGVLSIVCADPHEYGEENTELFQSDLVKVLNSGTYNSTPYLKLKALEDITHVQLYNEQKFFQLGNAVEVGTTVRAKEERLLNEALGSLVGWGFTGMQVDGGIVSGAMETNGYSVGALNFGTDPDWKVWRGPAMKKSIPQAPLEDFKIRVPILHKNPNSGARGRMEIYLLDSQNQDFGKFAMKRTGGGNFGNSVEARAGGGTAYKYFANYAGAKGIEWRDFDGVLELSRVNNVWEIYVARVDPVTKRHTARYRERFPDLTAKYSNGLAQIQLHIGQSGQAEPTQMRFGGVEVYRINPDTGEETNIMAFKDDILEVDFRTKSVFINGELRADLFAFGSEYFKIDPGSHIFQLAPEGKLEGQLSWREVFR